MSRLAIVDSGGANIASLKYALGRLQVDATLTSDADLIRGADRVLLPGVGAARDAMSRLKNAGLVDVIRGLTQPVLGICLGMQLLCESSDEENVDCLGIIPGVARRLVPADNYPVPNMGWCKTHITSSQGCLNGIENNSYFYYLHSYALPVSDSTLAIASHGDEFSAVIGKDNFVAVQFHPERSSFAGSQLLKNFLGLPL